MKEDIQNQRERNKFQKGIFVAGTGLILFALASDLFGLSDPGIGGGQILLASMGLVLIVIGLLGRGIVQVYRISAVILLNTVLLVLGLEIGLRLVGSISSRLFPQRPAQIELDSRTTLPYYAGQEWSSTFWTEWPQFNSEFNAYRYYPYATWRGGSFEGATINVNQDGIRLTPGSECHEDAYKVFMFGGSTLWGMGAPDWLTIPALVQSQLENTSPQSVCVINFGQTAYISTQGLITLNLELQRGNLPNLVIFYDGVNDTGIAFTQGQAQLHANYPLIARRFNQEEETDNTSSIVEWLSGWRLFQTLQGMVPVSSQNPPTPAQQPTIEIEWNELAEEVVQVYLNSYRLVNALAQEYGFEYYFFWQPVMFVTRKPLTQDEQRMWEEGSGPVIADLYVEVYNRIELAEANNDHLFYVADMLDNEHGQIFIDYNHITPEGNQIIAQEILRVIGSD
jgi:lysophospholipase L1-like esterase